MGCLCFSFKKGLHVMGHTVLTIFLSLQKWQQNAKRSIAFIAWEKALHSAGTVLIVRRGGRLKTWLHFRHSAVLHFLQFSQMLQNTRAFTKVFKLLKLHFLYQYENEKLTHSLGAILKL